MCNKTLSNVSKCNVFSVTEPSTVSVTPLRMRVCAQEPETLVSHLFGGVLRSQVKCGGCGAESNTLDPFLDLSLELLGCSSVEAALRKFAAAETLAGANAYKCDKCKRCVGSAAQPRPRGLTDLCDC